GYVLVHSHRKAYRFYPTNDIHALMDGHVQAFTQFGGAAEETKYDSQKPVVLRWEGNQPIYNLRFVDFATHYSFRLSACRRGHPNDKSDASYCTSSDGIDGTLLLPAFGGSGSGGATHQLTAVPVLARYVWSGKLKQTLTLVIV